MIEQELLLKLIEEATIYDKVAKKVKLKESDYIKSYSDYTILYTNRIGCNYDINNLFETEQEAQFVADNHTTRVERFEPPFELKYRERYDFLSSNWHYCYIENGENFYYVCYTDLSSEDNDIYTRFSTYSEAVAYARKLFDGEE